MKRQFLSLKVLFVVIFSALIVFSCENNENEDIDVDESTEDTENYYTANSYTVNTYEIITLTSNIELEDSYQALFDSDTVSLIKTSDTTLAFIVPEIESGNYQLTSDLGNLDFEVEETSVTDPEALIDEIFSSFDDEVSDVDSSQDLTDAVTYKNEVMELYNSLTDAQKTEVAMYYEANKNIFDEFKEDISNTYDASVIYKSTAYQSDCPKTDYKSFYSCTAENLGNSALELTSALKKAAVPLGYAAVLGGLVANISIMGPPAWALAATGASLTVITAIYIIFTEVRPACISLKTSLSDFLYANWIFVYASYDVITDEFQSMVATDLNLNASYKTLSQSDSDISTEVSFFNSKYQSLTSSWEKFTEILGDLPTYTENETSVDLSTEDITISNISNSSVELESQEAEKVSFKSTSGEDETFSYDITVEKEGFTQTETVENAIVYAEIDSTEIYEAAVTGSWTVTNLESSKVRDLTIESDGEGFYYVEDGANSDDGEGHYYITWSIEKDNGKYFLRESGFWHYGYESYRSLDTSLSEVSLTYPVSTFLTYTDFGDGASAALRYTKN